MAITSDNRVLVSGYGLKYLYTIRNTRNRRELYPIGSLCINKFGREDLDEDVSVKDQLFRLFHYVFKQDRFITLSKDLFSRKLIRYLHSQGVFRENEYNDFDSGADCRFLLKMFNKRDKDSISERQQKKISAIILTSVKPYLQDMLADRIR